MEWKQGEGKRRGGGKNIWNGIIEWNEMEGKGRDGQSCVRLVGQLEDPPGFCYEWDKSKAF